MYTLLEFHKNTSEKQNIKYQKNSRVNESCESLDFRKQNKSQG